MIVQCAFQLTTGSWRVRRNGCCWGRPQSVGRWKRPLGRWSADRCFCPHTPAVPSEKWSNVAAESSSLLRQTERTNDPEVRSVQLRRIHTWLRRLPCKPEPPWALWLWCIAHTLWPSPWRKSRFCHRLRSDWRRQTLLWRLSWQTLGLMNTHKHQPRLFLRGKRDTGRKWARRVNKHVTVKPVDGSLRSDAFLLWACCSGDVKERSQEVAGGCCVQNTTWKAERKRGRRYI